MREKSLDMSNGKDISLILTLLKDIDINANPFKMQFV